MAVSALGAPKPAMGVTCGLPSNAHMRSLPRGIQHVSISWRLFSLKLVHSGEPTTEPLMLHQQQGVERGQPPSSLHCGLAALVHRCGHPRRCGSPRLGGPALVGGVNREVHHDVGGLLHRRFIIVEGKASATRNQESLWRRKAANGSSGSWRRSIDAASGGCDRRVATEGTAPRNDMAAQWMTQPVYSARVVIPWRKCTALAHRPPPTFAPPCPRRSNIYRSATKSESTRIIFSGKGRKKKRDSNDFFDNHGVE